MADIALLEAPNPPALIEQLAVNYQLFFLQEMGTERLVPPDQIGPPGIQVLARLGVPAFEGRPNSIAPAGLRACARLGLPAFQGAILPPVNPTIQVVSPAPGGSIDIQAPWVVDLVLVPSDGSITRIQVTVAYANLNTHETAYQGDALDPAGFTPDFGGASKLTVIDATRVRLSIIRNGGWPAAPRIFVSATTNRGGLT